MWGFYWAGHHLKQPYETSSAIQKIANENIANREYLEDNIATKKRYTGARPWSFCKRAELR
jgi:hypothetical protein